MQDNQQGAVPADETLHREAGSHAERSRETPGESSNGPSHDEATDQWQTESDRKRAKEENRARLEERNRAQRQADWERFIQTQRRELELRKDGQLARLIGEPLPGERPEALRRLTYEDKRQAQEGLVALMSGGKLFYKHLDELTPEDMPARIAADRLRETWLKKRQDGWLAHGEGAL